jgi:nucleoid-associated protein YgaU
MVQPMNSGQCAFWTPQEELDLRARPTRPVSGATLPNRWATRRATAPSASVPQRDAVAPRGRSRRAQAAATRWRALKTALVVLILGTATVAMGLRLWRAASAAPSASVVVSMTVRPGDSLWSLARRYGDQKTYILDRVDVLARANRLSASAPLVPGQKLTVPVANPAEIAMLRRTVAAGTAQRQ